MFRRLPDSAWADRNLAEVAGQVGKMVEQQSQSPPNPTQVHEQMGYPVQGGYGGFALLFVDIIRKVPPQYRFITLKRNFQCNINKR